MATLDTRLANITPKKLRQAKYNPRSISVGRLDKLHQSMAVFGDLSGVVFNVRTGNLVSGHQRMKKVNNHKSRIVQVAHKDALGTIAVGHIEVELESGNLRIPYRAVDWHIKQEKAANIAANAHGGNFDKEKLALVLADIENVKEFDIEVVGLDPLTLRSLRLPKDTDSLPGPNHASGRKEFKEFGDDLETEHVCPKCHYRF